MSAPPNAARRISGAVFIVVMLAIAAVLFYLLWVLESPSSTFYALVGIGVLALVFGAVAYILEALVARPELGQAVSWGFLGMGFAVLFATAGFYPDGSVFFVPTRLGLILGTLAALAVVILGFYWRSGQIPAEEARIAERRPWQSRPAVSAFEYPTARPSEAAPPPSPPPPASPPGGP
ncbi:MAG: hypothetical protein ACREC5_00945 [Thermoplasmata archaeon]